MSAKKATEMIRYYKNPNGPTIGVTAKDVIESDGLYFKDLNGDGTLNTYKDWRKTPSERAKALAEELSSEEKIGLLHQFFKNGSLPGRQRGSRCNWTS